MAISTFQFSNPILKKCRFELLKPDDGKNLEIEINITRNVAREPNSNSATVELLLQLNKQGDVVRENAPFFVEVAMVSDFTWDPKLDEDTIESLLNYNAMSLLISYIRPVIVSITYMRPGGALNLPFINLREIVPTNPAIEEK